MSDLVALDELLNFLSLTEEDAVVASLADAVEALLVKQCSRGHAPFQQAQLGRIEYHDGNDRHELWLDYNVVNLTSVILGLDPAVPDETLSLTDPAVLAFGIGSARLARNDGGFFGCKTQKRYIKVTYDAGEELPEDAKLAVMRVTGAIYRQRGSEDVKAERMGAYSGDIAEAAKSDPIWQMAVNAHSRSFS